MPERLPVVAVINTSPDTVELLRMLFEQSGFLVVTGLTYDIRDGRMNLEAFVRQHKPDVVVYDIAPPYDRNWAFFQHLRTADIIRTIPVVLTTTNKRSVRAFVSDVPEIHELVGKPYDLDEIVQAVRAATGTRTEDAEL
jgi:CheY-like chemotaxis protein